MKYLKSVLGVFVLSLFLSSMGVSGVGIVMMNDVIIPNFKGTYTSNYRVSKTDETYEQSIAREYCVDSIGRNSRSVSAKAKPNSSEVTTEWVNTVDYINIELGEKTKNLIEWNLLLQANTNSLTTAVFYGTWYY